jgi:hypothetical protein
MNYVRPSFEFPTDFMFQLTWDEVRLVRSQIVTLPDGHLRYRPHAFTEHGAVMLASVLKSPVAVAVSVQVVRAFVRLRQMIASNEKTAAETFADRKKAPGPRPELRRRLRCDPAIDG